MTNGSAPIRGELFRKSSRLHSTDVDAYLKVSDI